LKKPFLSVITVVFNNAAHIRDSINSVLSQDYPHIEYLVIDGGSTDGTIEIINEYKEKISVFVSEPDGGIYDALNKGIELASGDFIGILHSDDLYQDSTVLSDMVDLIKKEGSEFAFANMAIVEEKSLAVSRYYASQYFRPWILRTGWMPPHPTCIIKKSLHNEFGLYSTKYKIVGDYDFFVRVFYGRKICWSHLNRVTIKMRKGGASNCGFTSKRIIASEIQNSLKCNGVWSHYSLQIIRYLIRLTEFILRPSSKINGKLNR
jgi:glycosyltransferase involved in cell wall biosynthesis